VNRPVAELADVVSCYGKAFIDKFQPLGYHKGVLNALAVCRTAALGGHVDRCNECGHVRVSYNSCRNRHCPKCQQVNTARWVMAREADLLPVGYFHMVFTLPDCLNALCHQYPKVLYKLLFHSVRDTLFAFAADPKQLGAEIGYIAVLHTWGQTLTLHPHLHCIIPAGGITVKGTWKRARGNGRFLFPVKALSPVFRAKFRDGLLALAHNNSFEVTPELLSKMQQTNWVVYAKEPFARPKQIVEYLGRYSHRVAISNHRLVSIGDGKVTFRYKDYRHASAQKTMTLDAMEFLRRFCLHILPPGFVKIRHYGFLSSRRKGVELLALQGRETVGTQQQSMVQKPANLSWQEVCRQKLSYDPAKCPCCKTGVMVAIELLAPRPPPNPSAKLNPFLKPNTLQAAV
jgi:hypothetical protein